MRKCFFSLHLKKPQLLYFSQQLYEATTARVEERRRESISALLWFLEDPATFLSKSESHSTILPLPPSNTLAKTARDLYVRLFADEEEKEQQENEKEKDSNNNTATEKRTKQEELQHLLSQRTSTSSKKGLKSDSPKEILTCIKRELAVLESTGERPLSLEKLYCALKSLPPSSTEAERSFSSAGLFVTKLRSRLSDKTIDMLCFLRQYFKNKV